MTPIDEMLKAVEWVVVEDGPALVGDGELPHVTHSGVLELMGKKLRCHRLSDGMTVFDADDFVAFWEGL